MYVYIYRHTHLHIKNGFAMGEEGTKSKKLGFIYFIHKNRFATIY